MCDLPLKSASPTKPPVEDSSSSLGRFLVVARLGLTALLWKRVPATAHLFRDVHEFRQTVLHGKHGLLIVNVDTRLEPKTRDRRRANVNQVPDVRGP